MRPMQCQTSQMRRVSASFRPWSKGGWFQDLFGLWVLCSLILEHALLLSPACSCQSA